MLILGQGLRVWGTRGQGLASSRLGECIQGSLGVLFVAYTGVQWGVLRDASPTVSAGLDVV